MISLAHAQTAAASSDPTSGLMQFLPMILMFAVLWFLMVRPQMKKAKGHKALLAALAKGDMAEYMRLAQEFQQKMMEQALGQQK